MTLPYFLISLKRPSSNNAEEPTLQWPLVPWYNIICFPLFPQRCHKLLIPHNFPDSFGGSWRKIWNQNLQNLFKNNNSGILSGSVIQDQTIIGTWHMMQICTYKLMCNKRKCCVAVFLDPSIKSNWWGRI